MAEVFVLVVVGVAIDDQHVFELALVGMSLGVPQELRGVEFIDRVTLAPAAVSNVEIHGVFSFDLSFRLGVSHVQERGARCSSSATFPVRIPVDRRLSAARRITMTSVAVTAERALTAG